MTGVPPTPRASRGDASRGAGRLAHLRRLGLLGALLAAGLGIAAPGPASAVTDDDWLGIVNTYRAMSGLAPVSANGTWSAEATAHSCYMLQNGIAHDETPGRPGYTPGGDVAGNSGNVAVSSDVSARARKHIDLWMTGPFHAIGILRHNLTTSGFGLCADAAGAAWKSGATLDVIRGLDSSRPRPTAPIVFPGNGVTIPLDRFVTDGPQPSGDAPRLVLSVHAPPFPVGRGETALSSDEISLQSIGPPSAEPSVRRSRRRRGTHRKRPSRYSALAGDSVRPRSATISRCGFMVRATNRAMTPVTPAMIMAPVMVEPAGRRYPSPTSITFIVRT